MNISVFKSNCVYDRTKSIDLVSHFMRRLSVNIDLMEIQLTTKDYVSQ